MYHVQVTMHASQTQPHPSFRVAASLLVQSALCESFAKKASMLNFGLHWSCSCFSSEAMIVGLGTKNILEVKAVLLPLSEMFNRFPDSLNLTKTNHSLIPSLE